MCSKVCNKGGALVRLNFDRGVVQKKEGISTTLNYTGRSNLLTDRAFRDVVVDVVSTLELHFFENRLFFGKNDFIFAVGK